VERPFRYIRQDFFLGRTFRDLEDLNRQLQDWLAKVANARLHGTTGRVVSEAFSAERSQLQLLPAFPFRSVLKLERRITNDGMVSVDGNLYSVPDGTRKRAVEVHVLANAVRILEGGILIAEHPVLEGKNQRSLLQGHRHHNKARGKAVPGDDALAGNLPGGASPLDAAVVWQRPLSSYDDAARALAVQPVARDPAVTNNPALEGTAS